MNELDCEVLYPSIQGRSPRVIPGLPASNPGSTACRPVSRGVQCPVHVGPTRHVKVVQPGGHGSWNRVLACPIAIGAERQTGEAPT